MKKFPFLEEILNYTIINAEFIKKHNILPDINLDNIKNKNLSKENILFIKKHLLLSSAEFKIWVINPVLKLIQSFSNYYKIIYSFEDIKYILFCVKNLWSSKYLDLPDNFSIRNIKRTNQNLKTLIKELINKIKNSEILTNEINKFDILNISNKQEKIIYYEMIFHNILNNNKSIKNLFNKIKNHIFSDKNISNYMKYFIVKFYIIKNIFK